MGHKVYLNGKFIDRNKAKLSIFDHGLLYGDGVFEGIRSYHRLVFKLNEHIDRLYKSADAIELKIPMAKRVLVKAVRDTLKRNKLDNAYIRLVVTRGPGDLGLDPRKCKAGGFIFIITDKITLYPKKFYEKGLHIVSVKTRKNYKGAIDPNIKSLNYLNNILAKIEAIKKASPEAIMLTHDDYVAECTSDNIFIVKGNTLLTPPRDISLKGITQNAVIDIARKSKIRFKEKNMKLNEIYKADECFLTGTAAEIVPVTRVDSHVIGAGKPGPVTCELMAAFRELTKVDGVRY
ncbi:MAG: branched-chain-amino-acid transaminase [Candidatus Omnitrophota bacterium]|nr:MAG: branched-chain-amino-acid transaminase [Candidatus Omnitrophota bacterium]